MAHIDQTIYQMGVMDLLEARAPHLVDFYVSACVAAASLTNRDTMTSPAASAGADTRHPFERRCDDVKIPKSNVHSLIMDFLVAEGFPSTATAFAMEAKIEQPEPLADITERVDIRDAIHAGRIQPAIEMLNELNPQILENDGHLHFALLRLQLIELIRVGLAAEPENILPAIQFGSAMLAPRATGHPEFLDDLNHAMALVVFPPERRPAAVAALLAPALRQNVATQVNRAIRLTQGVSGEARIRALLRLRAWAEKKARFLAKDLPSELILGLDVENEGEASNGHGQPEGNGHSAPAEPMDQ